jgi:mannitol-1-/sugar-/sorbitol-6-phosphatase
MLFRAQALLVDIDGTLVDSTAAVIASWTAWAATQRLDVREILRVCHGRRARDTVAMFLPAERVPAATRQLEELELAALDGVTALPGADVLVRDLPSNRWAGVTSGSQALMRARLAAAGLPVPAVLITGEDVSRGKPDPEGYLAASAALGYDIAQCVVIEDAPAGIAAGRAAGAWTVAVATSHDGAELRGADIVVQDLTRCAVELRTDHVVLSADQHQVPE